jgi:hypothetical protein
VILQRTPEFTQRVLEIFQRRHIAAPTVAQIQTRVYVNPRNLL